MESVNTHSVIGTLAAVVSVIGFIPYIISILKNKTRPSGASWWTWTLLAGITVISSRIAGAPWQVLILPMWLCASQLLVALLSIKKGDNNWDGLNKSCVGGALVGIVLWLITGQPLIALIFSIIADFFASIPNWRHAWRNPEQENIMGWTIGWFSAVLQLFAIRNWSIAESAWGIYFFATISVTLFLVLRPKFKLK
jgi:hypothetical protein